MLASTIISIQSSRCSFATPTRPVRRRNAPFLSSHGIASTATATPLKQPVSSRLGSATTSEPASRRPEQGYPNFSIASAVQPQSISDKRPGSALTRPPLLKCSSMFRVVYLQGHVQSGSPSCHWHKRRSECYVSSGGPVLVQLLPQPRPKPQVSESRPGAPPAQHDHERSLSWRTTPLVLDGDGGHFDFCAANQACDLNRGPGRFGIRHELDVNVVHLLDIIEIGDVDGDGD